MLQKMMVFVVMTGMLTWALSGTALAVGPVQNDGPVESAIAPADGEVQAVPSEMLAQAAAINQPPQAPSGWLVLDDGTIVYLTEYGGLEIYPPEGIGPLNPEAVVYPQANGTYIVVHPDGSTVITINLVP